MTVEELVKEFRALHAKERQRQGHTVRSYANAGMEAMALSRSNAAAKRFVNALLALQKDILALPEGKKLLKALEAESNARDRGKAARDMHDGSWARIKPSIQHELAVRGAEIKDLVYVINCQLERQTQGPKEDELEAMAALAKNVFRESPACTILYLGGGVHEGDQSTWNVYTAGDNEHVGTIETVWPKGPGGPVEYEGSLFSESGPGFLVVARRIDTVLLHLGIEVGRRHENRAARTS